MPLEDVSTKFWPMGFGGTSPRSRQSPEMPQVVAASIFLGRIVFSCRIPSLNSWTQVDYVSQKAEAYELEAGCVQSHRNLTSHSPAMY